jgi:hypothetical protein
MAFTEQQREEKWYALRGAAENEFWGHFSTRTTLPGINLFRMLMIKSMDIRAYTQEERAMLIAARDTTTKLDNKINYLDSLNLNQEAEFNALTWTSTP